ncbi:GMC family oxidoreductase [Pseudaminobacter arsenicus]|uniref:GMC family oxidoreductase n=1 Tax=Borborobacter arsenicus TaxID=1851146 RepID=A0A432VBR2_9HYPH|nr:GMC family oxidoreductase [Pseudaminobacter arsenicus]RUM99575.1 GMC family oxidoreductase [Pseudaminobacter arsenicus]
MTIASELPKDGRSFDVCIAGAGPAGLAVALECEARGLSIIMIEAGGLQPRSTGLVSEATDILDKLRHGQMNVVTRQALGGTSWAWGGECIPFDRIDFEPRDHVPHSGWPIGYKDIAAWHGAAAKFLACGSPNFFRALSGWEDLASCNVDHIGRFSTSSNLANRYRNRLERSPNILLCVGKTVTGIEMDVSGSTVSGLNIRNSLGGATETQKARFFVLAGGGVRTTHLLLNLQRSFPHLLGGDSGPLGRYYMGHIAGEISTIVFNDPKDSVDFLFQPDSRKVYALRRIKIKEGVQKREGLLNTAFMLRNPAIGDHRHMNGALSLINLCLSNPLTGQRFFSRRLSSHSNVPPSPQRWKHVGNTLRAPMRTVKDIKMILQQFLQETKIPVLIGNNAGRYTLRYHAEQVPNPESRIRLADQFDRFGEPTLKIDFRFTDQDARSVLRAHEILDHELRMTGRGYLDYWYPLKERLAAIMDIATDGYHQAGTTRMKTDPQEGVVDESCRVHQIRNLYIASSSVFPTTGSANPTFSIVAFALRLAAHLSGVQV